MRSDGSGEPRPLGLGSALAFSFSPDGRHLVLSGTGGGSNDDINMVSLEDPSSDDPRPGKSAPLLATSANEQYPAISPDGHWLAYTSDESSSREIYVRSFLGPGGKWQVSTAGGAYAEWSPKGGELFYYSGAKIVALSYSVKGDSFLPGATRVWYDGGISSLYSARNFSVAPDGKSAIAVLLQRQEGQTSPLTFLMNFLPRNRTEGDPGPVAI